MDLFAEESKKFVAHYTSMQTLSLILDTGSLRLGQLGRFNDLAEAAAPMVVAGIGGAPNIHTCFSKAYTESVVASCFSMGLEDFPGRFEDVEHTCFGNLLTWAHYGDRWHGVALVFDKEELKQQAENHLGMPKEGCHLWAEKIEYSNVLRPGLAIPMLDDSSLDGLQGEALEVAIRDSLAEYIRPHLFQKDLYWSSEREWRLAAISTEHSPLDIPLGKALKAMVFGPRARASSEFLQRIDVPKFSLGKSGSSLQFNLHGPL